MTTRKDLRANALQHIKDAETLLKSGSDKGGCCQAALAVEMILKARLCRAMSWNRYPASRGEAKTFNQAAGLPSKTPLLIHDLDDLMMLNEDNSIFHRDSLHVDWPKVSDWGIENRYAPLSYVSAEDANIRVTESAKVVHELFRYEMHQELLDMEAELTERYGLPYLFAISMEDQVATLLISFAARDDEHFNSMKQWLQDRMHNIDSDLMSFSSAKSVDPNSAVVNYCIAVAPVKGALFYSEGNFVSGIDCDFTGLIVTAYSWTEIQIRESWESATEITASASA